MLRITVIVLLFAALLPILLWAQPNVLWTQSYSFEGTLYLRDLISTSDGGFLLAGSSRTGVNGYRLLLLKTDANGDSLWSRSWLGTVWHAHSMIQQAPDGGYLVAAWDPESSMSAFYLMKVSATGDSLWSRTLGEGFASVLLERASNSNYLIACVGTLLDFNNIALLMRIDVDGNVLWQDTLYGNNITPRFVGEWTDGSIFNVSQVLAERTGIQAFDLCVQEFSAAGDSLWAHCAPAGDFNHSCEAILQNPDGNMVYTGGNWPCTSEGQGNPWIVQWTIAGDTVRSATYGGECDYIGAATDIIPAAGGGYALAGMYDVELLRIGENYDSLWCLDIPEEQYVAARVRQLDDRSFVLAGTVNLWGDFFLLKTTPEALNAGPHVHLPPSSFSLSCYPNPFNPSTQISLSLAKEQTISLKVFNVSGREVTTLINGKIPAGEHRIAFDGAALSSGVYFARLSGMGISRTQKLLLLK